MREEALSISWDEWLEQDMTDHCLQASLLARLQSDSKLLFGVHDKT